MNKKTLTQIDYYRIRDEIAEYCVSQEGKKNILEREPFKDIEEIEKNKNLSREWEKYFSKNYSNPLFGWENIKNLLPIIKMNGSSLTLEQVNNLGHFILSVNNVKKAIENHKIELELTLLPEQIYQIPDLKNAEKKIFNKLIILFLVVFSFKLKAFLFSAKEIRT